MNAARGRQERTSTAAVRGRTLGRPAFTMLELVLVVSIVGVLSAIAVPRLTRAGEGAEYAAQHRDWQMVQKQIELYAVEHFGAYPAGVGDGVNAAGSAAAFARQMSAYSDVNGAVAAAMGSPFTCGPYLRDGLPAIHYGPHKGRTSLRVITGTTAPTYQSGFAVGWIYNATTGDIIPNVPARAANQSTGHPLVEFGVYGLNETLEVGGDLDLEALGP